MKLGIGLKRYILSTKIYPVHQIKKDAHNSQLPFCHLVFMSPLYGKRSNQTRFNPWWHKKKTNGMVFEASSLFPCCIMHIDLIWTWYKLDGKVNLQISIFGQSVLQGIERKSLVRSQLLQLVKGFPIRWGIMWPSIHHESAEPGVHSHWSEVKKSIPDLILNPDLQSRK